MSESRAYTPAASPTLRWLTATAAPVDPEIHRRLLGELFTSRTAVLMGVLNGLVLNGSALLLCHRIGFAMLMAIDLCLAVVRLAVLQRVARAPAQGRPTPTDAYLVSAILWSALQGGVAVACWQTGNHTLHVLSAATILGLLGPLCARNYPAPRLALLLVALCDVPFAAGAALAGDPWMLVLVAQTPLYLLGSMSIVRRFHTLALATLQAEHDSQHRARHDPLTGLLNRLGFDEDAGRLCSTGLPFVVFFIDLDGFKAVNDTLGHHAGDVLLHAVAMRLLALAHRDDIVGRIGGDEFVLVAHDMRPAQAELFARRLVDGIGGRPYTIGDGRPARIGASAGYACAPEDGADLEELCRKADAALYRAKAGGHGVQRLHAA